MARSSLTLRQVIDFNLQGASIHGDNKNWQGIADPSGSVAYSTGDIVVHDGILWIALRDNDNVEPGTSDMDWVTVGAEPGGLRVRKILTQEQWDAYVTESGITTGMIEVNGVMVPGITGGIADGTILKFSNSDGSFNPMVIAGSGDTSETYNTNALNLIGVPIITELSRPIGTTGDFEVRFNTLTDPSFLTANELNPLFGTSLTEDPTSDRTDTATGVFVNFSATVTGIAADGTGAINSLAAEIRGFPQTSNGQLVRFRPLGTWDLTNNADAFVFLRTAGGAGMPATQLFTAGAIPTGAVEWDSTLDPATGTASRFVPL